MSENIHERYGPNRKKKGKRRANLKEGRFFKKTYEWLKWRIAEVGSFSFHRPCLDS